MTAPLFALVSVQETVMVAPLFERRSGWSPLLEWMQAAKKEAESVGLLELLWNEVHGRVFSLVSTHFCAGEQPGLPFRREHTIFKLSLESVEDT